MTATIATLARLREEAIRARQDGRLSEADVTVRGVWRTSYQIRLAETSSVLRLDYVVVQTVAQGCSYYEAHLAEPTMDGCPLGSDVLARRCEHIAWEIAALDAVYAHLLPEADETHMIVGNNVEKTRRRATIVTAEVERLVRAVADKPRVRVVNVGVVGDFLDILTRNERVEMTASDYADGIVGKAISGVTVEHGSETENLVAEADVALVTGMTLANGSFDRILAVAREHRTRIVVFAQTGSHFADVYRRLGVDAVVSEPLPFYLSGEGPSTILVFRREP